VTDAERDLLAHIREFGPTPKQRQVHTKGMKKRTHDVLDPLWQDGRLTRREAYFLVMRILKIHDLERCHIRYLTEQQCRQLINVIETGRYSIADAKAAGRIAARFPSTLTSGPIRFPRAWQRLPLLRRRWWQIGLSVRSLVD